MRLGPEEHRPEGPQPSRAMRIFLVRLRTAHCHRVRCCSSQLVMTLRLRNCNVPQFLQTIATASMPCRMPHPLTARVRTVSCAGPLRRGIAIGHRRYSLRHACWPETDQHQPCHFGDNMPLAH